MQEPHVTDLIPAYVLGALEPEEVDMVERHLEGCAACSAELRAQRRIAEELLVAPAQRSAPPQVRERLLEQIRALGAAPSAQGALPAAAAAEQTPQATPQPAPRSSNRIARAWQAAFGRAGASTDDDEADQELRDLMLDPESIVIAVSGTPDAPAASARLIASPQRGKAVLLASGLKAPGAGRAYQIWFLRNGQPVPNALFAVDRRGRGLSLATLGAPLGSFDTVAVTQEPEGGSPSPTGPIVLAGALRSA
ncbi:MAG TPA: anti-sigma factor [Ktedonobacterales bacterium]|nr:anti-sigma factor [Ktedonobacterales bacterium]